MESPGGVGNTLATRAPDRLSLDCRRFQEKAWAAFRRTGALGGTKIKKLQASARGHYIFDMTASTAWVLAILYRRSRVWKSLNMVNLSRVS